MSESRLSIVTICGTSRPGNYTSKALALVLDEFGRDEELSVERFDPTGEKLVLPGLEGGEASRESLQRKIASATGIVFATPEYHGTFSACSKLIIENLGYPSVLAGKPVALLGVAAGQIGAIKSLEHLRSVLSHVGSIVLPGPVSVAGVRKAFDEEGRCLDEAVEKRVRGVAHTLLDYLRLNVCPRVALERLARE